VANTISAASAAPPNTLADLTASVIVNATGSNDNYFFTFYPTSWTLDNPSSSRFNLFVREQETNDDENTGNVTFRMPLDGSSQMIWECDRGDVTGDAIYISAHGYYYDPSSESV
jgi:hypothetical protein